MTKNLMRKPKMIKNVIFDVDGVLRILNDAPLLPILNKDLQAKNKDRLDVITIKQFYKKYCLHSNPDYLDYDKGVINEDELAEKIYQKYGEPIDVFNEAFDYRLKKENQTFFEPTFNLIKKLKDAGFKTFILSNMGKKLADKLKEFIDTSLFDDIVFSCEVHIMKPNLDFYEYVISKWDIDPTESIFIDDREENLKPFSLLGGHTFLFDKESVENSVKNLEKYIFDNK